MAVINLTSPFYGDANQARSLAGMLHPIAKGLELLDGLSMLSAESATHSFRAKTAELFLALTNCQVDGRPLKKGPVVAPSLARGG